MPLTIRTDKPNTNAETNQDHFNMATYCMVTGVGEVKTPADLEKLVTRTILLGLLPENVTPDQFVRWVKSFGHIRTNASKRTDADVAKSAREEAQRRARALIKRAETPEATPAEK